LQTLSLIPTFRGGVQESGQRKKERGKKTIYLEWFFASWLDHAVGEVPASTPSGQRTAAERGVYPAYVMLKRGRYLLGGKVFPKGEKRKNWAP